MHMLTVHRNLEPAYVLPPGAYSCHQSRAYGTWTCDTLQNPQPTRCILILSLASSVLAISSSSITDSTSVLGVSLPAGVAIVSHPASRKRSRTISRPAVDPSAHTDLPTILSPFHLTTHSSTAPSSIRLNHSRHNRAANTCRAQWSRLPTRPSRSVWPSPSSSSEAPRPAQTFADAHNRPKMDRPQWSEVF